MKATPILAIVAVFAVLLCPVAFGDSDAAVINNPDNSFVFDNMDGGTITFYVDNAGGSSFDMYVTVYEGSDVVAEKTVRVAAEDDFRVDISMPGFTEVGTHHLKVVCDGDIEGPDSFNVTVEVKKNILSNWITYAVIAIVVIVIAIFAYLKMRDTPKQKVEMTFEQLEAERKAEMASKAERKSKPQAPNTERQRYLADKKKKQ